MVINAVEHYISQWSKTLEVMVNNEYDGHGSSCHVLYSRGTRGTSYLSLHHLC